MVNVPVDPDRDHAWQLLTANSRAFDRELQAREDAEGRLAAMQLELEDARAESARLLNSASWRLTRPLRSLLQLARPSELSPEERVQLKPVSSPEDDTTQPLLLDYSTWIRTEEPKLRKAISKHDRGRSFVQSVRLGLVLIKRTESDLDQALLASCPSYCTILVLDSADKVVVQAEANDRIYRSRMGTDSSGADIVSLALKVLDVDFLCFLDARDRLSPYALGLVSDTISRNPQLDLIFADEDWLDTLGLRVRPFFKPALDLALLRGCDLLGPFTFLRTSLVRELGSGSGAAWHYELTSRIAALVRRERAHRIPIVLCHRVAPTSEQDAARPAAVARQLESCGIAAGVARVPDRPEWARVTYELPHPVPMVSVIIPTRDHPELLQACTMGLLNATNYERFELLIVDNGTTDSDAVTLLEELAKDQRVRVLVRPGPFNWSALNNYAAGEAVGDFLLLLNNDTVVLDPSWLSEIISQAIQPRVGAVGAKLLYPDGRVQHAGLTTDANGLPRHLLRFASTGPVARLSMLELAREVWGLTGACLAVSRRLFLEIGGLNEALPIGSNDVDFCLRLTAFGYRLVWTPWARVEHRELATRGPSVTVEQHARVREEIDRMTRDWGSLLFDDPYLHPAFDPTDDALPFRRF